jgi:hypothetical protein
MRANRWVEHHTIELVKLTQLCDIFDNDNKIDCNKIKNLLNNMGVE